MKKSIFHIATLSIYVSGLLLSNTISAASFNCAKATSQVEKMICSDHELSELDSSLGDLYRHKAKSNPSAVKDQRLWLLQQRNLCRTADCVRAAYLKRISDLKLANNCPFEGSELIGGWVKTEGEGFEEVKLLSDDNIHNFLSWIHHRPEMVGRWTFQNCTVHIQDLNNEELQFDFEVQQLNKSTMRLRDMDSDTSSNYKRADSAK